jgi:hypothetical protein
MQKMKFTFFFIFLFFSYLIHSQYQLYGLNFDQVYNHVLNQNKSTVDVSETGKSKIILQTTNNW